MAFVSKLRIHPIKALDGVSVEEARVLPSGALEQDRRFALFDGRGRCINGKNRPAVQLLRADYDLPRQEVAISGRVFSLQRQVAELAAWLAQQLNEPVELREDALHGFPDDTASPGPTFVAEASLALVAEWFGLALEQCRLRFRTNVELAGVPAFWEDQTYGSKLSLGGVTIGCVNPCQRCVVPTRDPLTGATLPLFQKQFALRRERSLPAAADRSPFNHYYRFAVNTRLDPEQAGKLLHVGDAVRPL